MLEFTEKLTLAPSAIRRDDVMGLLAHGLDERDIVSVVIAAAYRGYIVRVADALGVELSAGFSTAPEVIQAFGVDAREARRTLSLRARPS